MTHMEDCIYVKQIQEALIIDSLRLMHAKKHKPLYGLISGLLIEVNSATMDSYLSVLEGKNAKR